MTSNNTTNRSETMKKKDQKTDTNVCPTCGEEYDPKVGCPVCDSGPKDDDFFA